MWMFLLLSVSVCLVGWVYARWVKIRNYWAKRGIKYVPPNPLVGSLTFIQRENPVEWLRRQYTIFSPAPYFGICAFWRPALVISSPKIARNILLKDADCFRNRYLGADSKNDPIGSLNIFTVNDPIWTSVRRRLTSIFTAAKLRALDPLMKTKSKELKQRMEADMKKYNKVDLREVYTDYTTDIIGTSAFGITSDATLTGDSPMRVVTRDFQTYNLWRGMSWCLIFFFPSAATLLGCTFFPKTATDYFRKVFKIIQIQRGGSESEKKENIDLMDALLKMKKDVEVEGEVVSNDLLIAQAAIFLQGGFDTSAVALSFITYELSFNSDVQDRLYNELSQAKAKNDGSELDPTTLAELPYLNAVIKEGLRKYSAMGWIDRIASQTYKVDDHLTIEKGTPVYICAVGMHYDPRYFPDPETYNPERFMPENASKIVPFTYMPFGEGPRNCIGIRFAYQTLRNALSALFFNYRVEPIPGAPKPSEVSVGKRGLFLSPGITLYTRIVPRN